MLRSVANWPPLLARRLLAPLTLVLLGGCTEPTTTDFLTVRDATVRELLPGSANTAAYVELHNPSDQPVRVIRATSSAVRSIEFHRTARRNNMMSMRRLEAIVVPAQGTLRLEPGGLHLMLFGVTALPANVDIQLIFDDGRNQTIDFRRVALGGN